MAKQGGTELFLESAEPDFSTLPLNVFLKRFPEGKYKFRGNGLNGERYFGTANFTHNIPDGPLLIAPLEGGPLQDAENTVLSWQPVAPANGSPIVGYQVIVVQIGSSIRAIPKPTLDVTLPATAVSLAIPVGFLLPGSEYEWEVLAIEASGNQTLTTTFFKTAP